MTVLTKEQIERLENAGYRIIGPNKHSAVKVCTWTKKAIRGEDFCYKQKFYGIASHRCLQFTPALPFCTHRCLFCWRDTSITFPKWIGEVDEPKVILSEAIEAQRELISGFKGNPNVSKEKFEEALNPNQAAISLAGEPTLYPKLPELIDEVLSRGMTAFLVTNGTNPSMLEKLLDHEPTQLYVTLAAPNERIYKKVCNPLLKDGWKRLNESLSMLRKFSCNTVVRLTLVRELNLVEPESYGRLIRMYEPKFVEVKAFMSVGFARKRLAYNTMPLHAEIKDFAKAIAKESGYKIIDEKSDSRVVLLSK